MTTSFLFPRSNRSVEGETVVCSFYDFFFHYFQTRCASRSGVVDNPHLVIYVEELLIGVQQQTATVGRDGLYAHMAAVDIDEIIALSGMSTVFNSDDAFTVGEMGCVGNGTEHAAFRLVD